MWTFLPGRTGFRGRKRAYCAYATRMSEALDAALERAADDPQQVTIDGETVISRPLADLIALDKHQRQVAAQAARRRGFRFSTILPPGMCD